MRLGLLVIQSIIGEKALALNDDLVYHLLFSAIDFSQGTHSDPRPHTHTTYTRFLGLGAGYVGLGGGGDAVRAARGRRLRGRSFVTNLL